MEKLYTSKTVLEIAGWRMHTLHSTPLDLPLAVSYRNHQNSLAYFSHLAPLLLFFLLKGRIKGEEVWRNAFPLNTLFSTKILLKIGKEEQKKETSTQPQMSCFFAENRRKAKKFLIHGRSLSFCKCPRAAYNGLAGRSLPSPVLDQCVVFRSCIRGIVS